MLEVISGGLNWVEGPGSGHLIHFFIRGGRGRGLGHHIDVLFPRDIEDWPTLDFFRLLTDYGRAERPPSFVGRCTMGVGILVLFLRLPFGLQEFIMAWDQL